MSDFLNRLDDLLNELTIEEFRSCYDHIIDKVKEKDHEWYCITNELCLECSNTVSEYDDDRLDCEYCGKKLCFSCAGKYDDDLQNNGWKNCDICLQCYNETFTTCKNGHEIFKKDPKCPACEKNEFARKYIHETQKFVDDVIIKLDEKIKNENLNASYKQENYLDGGKIKIIYNMNNIETSLTLHCEEITGEHTIIPTFLNPPRCIGGIFHVNFYRSFFVRGDKWNEDVNGAIFILTKR